MEPNTPAAAGSDAPAVTPGVPGSDAPAAPVTPPAPGSDTPTPPAPEAPAEDALTPEEQAQKAEDDEWENAEKEVFPGIKGAKSKEGKDEPAKPETTTETTTQTTTNSNPEKPNEEPGNGDGTEKTGEEVPTDPAELARATRVANRQYTEEIATIKSDIMKTVYADVPEFLQDADGDPIRTIDDVMKLTNPRTGEGFTEEEAGMWLLSAQQQFNEQKAQIEKEAERIAEVNYDLADQARIVNEKYGEYLKAHPELRDELWADFMATLVLHEKSQKVIKMPVSLERYYERNLKDRVAAESNAAADAAAKAEADKKAAEEKAAAEAKAKKDEEDRKRKARADRSDVFGAQQQKPETDPEDDEWAEAEKTVFGNRLN